MNKIPIAFYSNILRRVMNEDELQELVNRYNAAKIGLRSAEEVGPEELAIIQQWLSGEVSHSYVVNWIKNTFSIKDGKAHLSNSLAKLALKNKLSIK